MHPGCPTLPLPPALVPSSLLVPGEPGVSSRQCLDLFLAMYAAEAEGSKVKESALQALGLVCIAQPALMVEVEGVLTIITEVRGDRVAGSIGGGGTCVL